MMQKLLLAQATDLPSVPDSTLKWTMIVIVTLILIVLAVLVALRTIKPAPVKLDQDPTPEVRKAAKRYNHDATEIRFSAIEQTVAKHEERLDKVDNRFAVDLPAMERRLDDANERRVSDVHERVNEILGEVKELRGEMKGRHN